MGEGIRIPFGDEQRPALIRLQGLCQRAGLNYNVAYGALCRIRTWAGQHARDGVLREDFDFIQRLTGAAGVEAALIIQLMTDARVLIPVADELFANSLAIFDWVKDQAELMGQSAQSQQALAGLASGKARRRRAEVEQAAEQRPLTPERSTALGPLPGGEGKGNAEEDEIGVEAAQTRPAGTPAACTGPPLNGANGNGNGNERNANENERVRRRSSEPQQNNCVVLERTTAVVVGSQKTDLTCAGLFEDLAAWARISRAIGLAWRGPSSAQHMLETWRNVKNFRGGRQPSESAVHDFLGLLIEAPERARETPEKFVFGYLRKGAHASDSALRRGIKVWEETASRSQS